MKLVTIKAFAVGKDEPIAKMLSTVTDPDVTTLRELISEKIHRAVPSFAFGAAEHIAQVVTTNDDTDIVDLLDFPVSVLLGHCLDSRAEIAVTIDNGAASSEIPAAPIKEEENKYSDDDNIETNSRGKGRSSKTTANEVDSSSKYGGNGKTTRSLSLPSRSRVEGGSTSAMLEDMPDEDDTTLAKRRAIQGLMRDRCLSLGERNKKIQAIMAGKVELPKVEKRPPEPKPQARAGPLTRRNERAREEEGESSYDSESDQSTSSEKNRPPNAASGTDSSPGNEAQLTGGDSTFSKSRGAGTAPTEAETHLSNELGRSTKGGNGEIATSAPLRPALASDALFCIGNESLDVPSMPLVTTFQSQMDNVSVMTLDTALARDPEVPVCDHERCQDDSSLDAATLRNLVNKLTTAGNDGDAIALVARGLVKNGGRCISPDASSFCLAVLRVLARKSDENKRKIVFEALDMIVEAMFIHRGSLAKFQRRACGLLWELSIDVEDRVRLHIARSGACGHILGAMVRHTKDTSLQVMALRCLKVLSSSHHSKMNVCFKITSSIVANAMQNHVHEPAVQSRGCVVLANLATSDAGRSVRTVTKKVVGAVVDGMHANPEEPEVHEAACSALLRLASSTANVELIRGNSLSRATLERSIEKHPDEVGNDVRILLRLLRYDAPAAGQEV